MQTINNNSNFQPLSIEAKKCTYIYICPLDFRKSKKLYIPLVGIAPSTRGEPTNSPSRSLGPQLSTMTIRLYLRGSSPTQNTLTARSYFPSSQTAHFTTLSSTSSAPLDGVSVHSTPSPPHLGYVKTYAWPSSVVGDWTRIGLDWTGWI